MFTNLWEVHEPTEMSIIFWEIHIVVKNPYQFDRDFLILPIIILKFFIYEYVFVIYNLPIKTNIINITTTSPKPPLGP